MRRASCAMAPLLSARRDGRLGEREIASLDRHLAGCASCRAASQRLARIAERVRQPTGAPTSPLDHQRRRLELLRTAALPRSSRALSDAPRALRVPPAAVLVFVTAALGLLLALEPPRHAVVVPVVARMPPIALPAPARTETTVRASAGARYERSSADGVERIELTDGQLDLEVRPLLRGERFVVATADAEVEVRGTIFRVEARDGRIVAVTVTEGKVEVRHRGASALIPAGGAWTPGHDPPAAAPSPRPAAPAGRPAAAASAAKDFALGVSLVERGDYAAAAEKLEAFRARNPGDARAEDAAYLGVLALQRAGQKAAAADAARRYLALYPHQPRSPAVRALLDAP